MILIAICEDEKVFRQDLKERIVAYMMRHGGSFQIDTFGSGEEFLALGLEVVKYTIIFLDINMKQMNGILTAKQIRAVSQETFIVFVTAYVDYTLEGYKVDAVRYLIKDDTNFQNALDECMDAIMKKMNYMSVRKNFSFRNKEKDIPLERLVYVESKLHKLEFYIMEQNMCVYTMNEKLNTIEQELQPYYFLRIHQSFLVNVKYIKDVYRYKVVLLDGTELAIAKVRYKTVKDAFMAYQGEI